MKIRKFNEDIDIKHVDPMEVCVKCGAVAVYIYDSSPLYCPDEYQEDKMNFDDQQYSDTICGNCGYKVDGIMGEIIWKPTDKQKEYAKLISKGINPVEIQKYNI